MIKKISSSQLVEWLLLAYLFLLPWQTRYIFEYGSLLGFYWEYTTLSVYATELLLWVIIGIYAYQLVRQGRVSAWFQLITKKKFLVGAFLAALLLSFLIWHSPDHFLSYYYIFHWLEAACLFLIIVQPYVSSRTITAFWLGAVGQAVFGMWQFATQEVAANKWLGLARHLPGTLGDFVVMAGDVRWLRAYGSFGSPNILGAYLVLGLVAGVFLAKTLPGKKYFVALAGQLLMTAGLLLTFSRGAWLAGVVGLLVIAAQVIHERKNQPQQSQRVLITVAAIVIFSTTLGLSMKPFISGRFTVGNRLEARSAEERATQFDSALKLFRQTPWFGTGVGRYTVELAKQTPVISQVQPVHNLYILLIIELGLIPFGALAWLAWRILRRLLQVNPASLPLVVVLLTLGLFEHFWWTTMTGVLLWWIVLGLSSKKSLM